MNIEGDIEARPPSLQGIKLPLDGMAMLNLSPKLQLSRQLLAEWVKRSKENIRPWSVFFATSRFKTPLVAQRLPQRVVKNVEYFQSNYAIIFAVLFLYCLITSPLLLIAVVCQLFVFYRVYVMNQANRTIRLFGRQLTLVQQYSLVGLCFMPIFYIVGAGAVLFWVLGASCLLILTHASFFDPQGLIQPDEESFELTMEQVV